MSKIVLNVNQLRLNLADLNFPELKVFMALAIHAGLDNHLVFRSVEMQAQSGVSNLTFKKALKTLAAQNLIKILSRKAGPGGTTEVVLNPNWLKVLP